MVVDTPAVVAALSPEPDAARYRRAIMEATDCRMSAFNVFECRAVLGRRFGDAMLREFELLLLTAEIGIGPFDAEQAIMAGDAYRRFGRGSGHPARLNLGDCAAYALAVSLGRPLLFKGEDFSRTDVRPHP
jgi:ribonuclease VapC